MTEQKKITYRNDGHFPGKPENAYCITRLIDGVSDFIFVGYYDYKTHMFTCYPHHAVIPQGPQDKIMLSDRSISQ